MSGWQSIDVAGHECEVFEPRAPSEHNFVTLYLHGVHLNRLRDYRAFEQELDVHGLRVVCPRTQRSWWTDRICNEFDDKMTAQQYLHRHVLPFVADRWHAAPPRIALFGTSMGGQGALRQAYKFPDIFPVVAAISPAIDYHTRHEEGDPTLRQMYPDAEAARQDTAILHIHPLNWPRHQWFCCDPTDYRWFDSTDRLRMKLASLGVPFECDLESSGGGHGGEYYQKMAAAAVRFLAKSLETERLRVV